jgi:hypothetical protein
MIKENSFLNSCSLYIYKKSRTIIVVIIKIQKIRHCLLVV